MAETPETPPAVTPEIPVTPPDAINLAQQVATTVAAMFPNGSAEFRAEVVDDLLALSANETWATTVPPPIAPTPPVLTPPWGGMGFNLTLANGVQLSLADYTWDFLRSAFVIDPQGEEARWTCFSYGRSQRIAGGNFTANMAHTNAPAASRKRTDEEIFGPLLPEIERLRCMADLALAPPPTQSDVHIDLEWDGPGWHGGGWRGDAYTPHNCAEGGSYNEGHTVFVQGRGSAWATVAALIRRWDTAGRPPARLRRTPIPERIDDLVTTLKDLALHQVGGRGGRELMEEGVLRPGENGFGFLMLMASRDSWAEIVDLIFPDASVTLREEVAFRVDTAYRNEATFGGAATAVEELRTRIAGGGVTPEQLIASVVWLVRLDVQSRCYEAFCAAACEAVAPEHTWSPTPLDRWHDFLRPNERTRWRFAGICPDAPYALTLAAAAGFVASMDLLVFGTAREAVEHARRAVVEHGTLSPENLELLVAAFWRGEDLAINEVPACLLLEERRFSRLAVLLLPDAATDLRAQVAHALADGLTDHDEELRLFGDAGGVLGSVEHLRQSVAESQLPPEQVVQSLLQMAELVKRIYGGVQASQFPAAFELLATARLLEFVAVVLPEAPASFQVKVQTLLAAPKPASPPDDPEKK
jgi:hypothetical protein